MKMTREERNWVLYDVGNSAFVLLVSTIMPLYFNYLAGSAGLSDSDYLAYWGYAASIATIIVAVMGSVTGTMADMKGFKKFLFTISIHFIFKVRISFFTAWPFPLNLMLS